MLNGSEIAIIGLAGKFPDAKNIEKFWHNLQAGVESITFFTSEELIASGIEAALVNNPNYVKARGILADAELFDASFFGFSPREAEITDPEHRLFLECSWEALENAGYNPENYSGLIGVYAGSGLSGYLFNVYTNESIRNSVDGHQMAIGGDKDYLTTRVSYKLNLQGPSYTIQTACSTSLVAVHLACQSLLNGECDMAVTGGVSISALRKHGSFYKEGGINSPDGHCRAFDAKAQGTVSGEGVGIVVLKRLDDALHDKDTIHAIIKGSAINNDGANKVSYTAPRIEGQAKVIRTAQMVAEVEPQTITCIEAHGTGTSLGDPIEIAALTQAFRQGTEKTGFCAIGSLKTNIGHLDTAAGIAGLIKTVLALKHKKIPPSLHYQAPNPQIDFANSPFYVNTQLTDWQTNGTPRRAGVSSFGIGGTNAHVILEEAPVLEQESKGTEEQRRFQLLILSAKTATALETATANLANYLQQNRDLNLADVAYTLAVGRKAFEHRRILVSQNSDRAITALTSSDSPEVFTHYQKSCHRPVVFMFTGQGSQYVNMGRELYETEPVFREQVDKCSQLLQPHLGLDLRSIIYPQTSTSQTTQQLTQTAITQPALFVIEYALAKLWMAWGVHPQAMIGHSIGEYVAATIAGVFSLEDALEIVAMRGKLMQQLPSGKMLAVFLSEVEITPLLNENLSLAANNAPNLCVVSGTHTAIDELHQQLITRGIECRQLHTSHAFHSQMMSPMIEEFQEFLGKFNLSVPQIPFISNLTGTWIATSQATDSHYWGHHAQQTVRFADGVTELGKKPEQIFLEVGPGKVLTNLVKQQQPSLTILSSLRHPREQQSDVGFLLNTLGQLWQKGIQINWSAFYHSQHRHRLPLPTYPFERKKYWVESSKDNELNGKDTHNNQKLENEQISSQSNYLGDKSQHLFIESHQNNNLNLNSKNETHDNMNKDSQDQKIVSTLKHIISESLGVKSSEIDIHTPFLAMGLDSLMLLQINHAIQQNLDIKIPFRLLFEDLSTIHVLAIHIAQELPPQNQNLEPSSQGLTFSPILQTTTDSILPINNSATQNLEQENKKPVIGTVIEQVIEQQLKLMSKQLDILQKTGSSQKILPVQQATPSIPIQHEVGQVVQSLTNKSGFPESPSSTQVKFNQQPINQTIDPPQLESKTLLTPRQQKHLDALIARFVKLTPESKRLTQAYRSCHANSRAITGFLPSIKEMLYPIHGQRGEGAKIWDVDGRKYVDISMGFGTLLFGHSPSFVIEAIQEQIKQGILHGPQSRLAGQVAELICELTGAERAAFCNDGTEAVMGAIRLARATTKRSKIALFAGSYHGTYDGTLVRGITSSEKTGRSIPTAIGIPSYIADDVIVLDYGQPESLEILKTHGDELAAVLVEPIQSSRPDLQPKEFLLDLRQLTQATGTVLIFDEVITGFRMHPGGIQGLWNIQADLTTYGKAVGAGMPIGVIAGKAALMDILDGGMWNYGDGSYPQVETTVFAGTFFKHPLVMAAAWAALNHIKNNGPKLQQELSEKTTKLAQTLNNYFEQRQVPIQVVHFGSLFRFIAPSSLKFAQLFFYHLLEKGVYVWEGRTFYLSTAHTDADIEQVIGAVKESVVEMQQGELLPPAPILTTLKIPLTALQKQLWFLAQMGDEVSRAYNESRTIHLRGAVNLLAIRKAVQEIINRHEALRTTFSLEGDNQLIHPSLTIEIPMSDFSTLDKSQRETQLSELLAREAQQIFHFEKGPLLSCHIVKLHEDHHLVILTNHHIVADGWSISILLRELAAIYSAECQGIASQLPQPMKWSEYALWEVQMQQSPEMAKAEAYWLSQFASSVPVMELPTDRPRPPIFSYTGARENLILDSTLYISLKSLSVQHGCTLFTILLTAFITLLQRLTNQQDIIVGIYSAGQSVIADQYLVGHCVNMLPIRSQVIGNPGFTEYLSSIQQVLLDAYEYQIYPFIKVIENLKLPRDPSRTPLFSAGFNLDKVQLESKSLQQEFEIDKNSTNASKLDIDLNIIQTDSELQLELEYNTNLFDSQTIQGWLGHYVTFLESVVTNPEQTLAQLPILTQTQRHQLLVEWNNTQTDYPREYCIHELFEAQVEKTPDAVAVIYAGESLTYAQLNHKANQLANYLQKLRVGAETLVGICLHRSLEAIVGILGTLKAGGAYVPLDPTYPSDRLGFMLQDAQVDILLTQESLVKQLPVTNAGVVCLDNDWETIAACSSQYIAHNSSLAYVIYTSGSTGEPKGVCCHHLGVLNLLADLENRKSLTVKDACSLWTSFSFDVSVYEIFSALLFGATLHIVPEEIRADSQGFIQWLHTHKITSAYIPPFMLPVLVNWLEKQPVKLSLKRLLVGVEPILEQTLITISDRIPGLHIINGYGPTEATICTTLYSVPTQQEHQRYTPIGKPVNNTQIYLLDQHLQPVPIGIPGEIYIGGIGLAKSYLNRPQLTSKKFIDHYFEPSKSTRLYKTGDIARYLPDGNIEFVGRSDSQVKIRGFRIELGEIESVLKQHPSVQETVVVTRDDIIANDQQLVAYIVPQTSHNHHFETEYVSDLELLYDQFYSWQFSQHDPSINLRVWTSRYTNQTIPEAEIIECVGNTVERILALQPQHVLEIGCGTGLILSRVAPHCQHYCGVDISQTALEYLQKLLEKRQPELLPKVTLLQGIADKLSGIEEQSVDVIILNEIIQNFPSIDYLVTVIERAVKILKPGGCIFLGGVRSLPLLEAFHIGVQLNQANPDLTITELKKQIQDSLQSENELVITPNFFTTLQQHLPQIGDVIMELKGGSYHNELTKFKYDVILRLGYQVDNTENQPWLDWQQQQLSVENVQKILLNNQPHTLKIARIPNARVAAEIKTLELLATADEGITVEQLREKLMQISSESGIDPQDFWVMAQSNSYTVKVSWSDNSNDGCYSVVFCKQIPAFHPEQNNQEIVINTPVTPPSWGIYANQPLQQKQELEIISQLRSFAQSKLPGYMLPQFFVPLAAFPLTPNGKIDRRALPKPAYQALQTDFVAPQTQTELTLAKIWSVVLQVENVGIHDNFFELGGNSLLTTKLMLEIRSAFQMDFPLRLLFESPTIASFAVYLDKIVKADSTKQLLPASNINWEQETILDSQIYPVNSYKKSPTQPQVILLTGATGFLGAFLLWELLQQTQADIYCLVRARDIVAGKQRIQETLDSYLIGDDNFNQRIIPVIGDLSQPYLGLNKNEFQDLTNKVDVIYHNGAWVNHIYPYSVLKPVNVLGTQEILRLACLSKTKPVHFVSTTSVFPSSGISGVQVITEADNIENYPINRNDSNGYVETKWVSEKLLDTVRDRGVPISIYRISRVSGHSQTGVFNVNDLVYKLIIGCIQLGSVPNRDIQEDMMPVDYVSKAIVYLSTQDKSLNQNFHLVNTQVLHTDDLLKVIHSYGYQVQQVSYQNWQSQLINIVGDLPEHPLYPLLPLFAAKTSQGEFEQTGTLQLDSQNVITGLADSSIICPNIDNRLLATYISYLAQQGFI